MLMEAGSFTPVFCLPASLLGKAPPVRLDTGQRPSINELFFFLIPSLTCCLTHSNTKTFAYPWQCTPVQCTPVQCGALIST